ncbi:M3 family metallopeptidase [Umboniibacter marinipuniceus]|uniref:oligopeptidase A n=1 Tax=Umboniibacter marinipuniceus TaxID=569599 RepID=A0A3M0AB99_9GAMM|nr:M3 family metallopeptidase [Umboniibacter marinipuniceus]RMA82150.1 oligopeptidase A [Umboniibacter marinipuniceus]
MTNPLIGPQATPPFHHFPIEQVETTINAMLSDARAQIAKFEVEDTIDWHWLARIEALDDELSRAWSPVSHLNNVCSTDELRSAHDHCIQALTAWHTERGQNEKLFKCYQQLAARSDGTVAQRTAVEHAIRGFKLSGIGLPAEQQQRIAELKQNLAQLSNDFSNNLLDCTQAWTEHHEDASQLAGLPAANLAVAKAAATAKSLAGYLLTLDAPQYMAVMMFADNRALRERLHRAFVSRASSAPHHDAKTDNSHNVQQILTARGELAELLGFDNYAQLSLATKMAESEEQVLNLLNDLAQRSSAQAKAEFAEVESFASELGLAPVQPWDVAYVSEKIRQQNYQLSQEELRPYFPVDRVVGGLFEVVKRLFNVDIQRDDTVATWHKDVGYYHLLKQGQPIASFYFDLFAREGKRGGAWMDDCRVRRVDESGTQLPVAYLTCNFTPPSDEIPSLLSHDEVTTLFHEFGHGLHHMLTEIDVPAVSGINGVAWDAVELPSQLLENWCWEPEVIPLISAHYETGEALPQALLEKLLAAKNFQSALFMVRQLEFAIYDFELHAETRAAATPSALEKLAEIRARLSIVPAVAENAFPLSFAHIFAGGYAAGYYSYKWAEVLSADAYSLFEELGIFSEAAAAKLFNCILSRGGSEPAADLYREFRGRDATIDALLRHSGIEEAHV